MARVTVIADDLLACDDCVQAIANDDYSGLDYCLSPDEAEAREAQIRAGIAGLGGYAVVGDEYGFTWSACDVCGSDKGGTRHTIAVLGTEEAADA